jgi:acetyl esterase/lipase
MEFRPNLTYHSVAQTHLELDLASPKGEGPFPALLIIRGLDPSKNGRQAMMPWIVAGAEKGYVAATISYRTKPEDGYLAPLYDAKAAVCWLRANAFKYRIDQNRIGVLGFSGGGTIACLLGMARPQDGLEGPWAKGSTAVQAVISYFPITDWEKLHSFCREPPTKGSPWYLGMQKRWIQTMVENSLGGPPSKVGANYVKASPITYARKGAAPLLLIHGSNDTFVPVDQSQALKQKMDLLGADVQMITVDHASHNFETGGDANARIAAAATWAYLEHHLKNATSLAKAKSELSENHGVRPN